MATVRLASMARVKAPIIHHQDRTRSFSSRYLPASSLRLSIQTIALATISSA